MSSFLQKKKTGSATFRAKKYLASRLADSSSGRATIVKFFGHSGDAVLQALQKGAEGVRGKDYGKQMM